MCNIAGYIGTDDAAAIVLDMIQRQEGLAGGYYTGLATIDGGRLHYDKVVGDSARLRKTTNAEDLPGTIAIAHSRSKSGGDREWGQPFIGCDDSLAYLANGSRGYWEDRVDVNAMAEQIVAQGHRLRAVSDETIGKYPVLADGRCVHVSDVMCHAIGGELESTGDPEEAIRRAFLQWPAEIVGLYITLQFPEAIYGARFNQPACVGRDTTGSYVASSPSGFPDSVRWWMWIAPDSVFSVGSQSLKISGLQPPDEALMLDIDLCEARDAILEALSDIEFTTLGELLKVVRPLSDRDSRRVDYQITYQILFDLQRDGLIERTCVSKPGVEENLTAPDFRFRLI